MPSGRDEEVLAAGMKILGLVSESHGVAFARAGAGGRVMQAAGIGDDAQHHAAFVGENIAACADIGRALGPERILGAVALLQVVSAVEQRIDSLLAVAVDDTDRLTFSHDRRPRRAGGDHAIEHDTGLGWDGRVHHNAHLAARLKPMSLFSKARMASALAVRQRSSLAAGSAA